MSEDNVKHFFKTGQKVRNPGLLRKLKDPDGTKKDAENGYHTLTLQVDPDQYKLIQVLKALSGIRKTPDYVQQALNLFGKHILATARATLPVDVARELDRATSRNPVPMPQLETAEHRPVQVVHQANIGEESPKPQRDPSIDRYKRWSEAR